MRALVAAALAALLALTALAPHVHVEEAGGGAHPCAVCQARTGDVALRATPELAPAPLLRGEASLSPGPSPVAGAPLGAVPGQSPPSPV